MSAQALRSLAFLAACGCAGAGKAALLIVDVQDCFLDKMTTTGQPGSLAVPASQIINVINTIRAQKSCLFDVVVRTQDFHPVGHVSFASTHGLPPFAHLQGRGALPITCTKPDSRNAADAACCPTQYLNPSAVNCSVQLCPPPGWSWSVNNSGFVTNDPACTQCKSNPATCFADGDGQMLWPDHCVQTGDASFPPNLTKVASDIIIQKGSNIYVDAYSAFMDNSGNLRTSLDSTLQSKGVDTLYIAGIATDVCVKWTVRDALGNKTSGYKVKVISDACAGLPTGKTPTSNHEDALAWMATQGAQIISSADVLTMSCPSTKDASRAISKHAPWSAALGLAGGFAVALALM